VYSDGRGNTTYTPGLAQQKGGVQTFFHGDGKGNTRYLPDGAGIFASGRGDGCEWEVSARGRTGRVTAEGCGFLVA
jgi:hypothetical protein